MELFHNIKDHIDNMAQPGVGVPVAGGSLFFNEALPMYINIASGVYLTLVVIHKAWQMYKEYKSNASG